MKCDKCGAEMVRGKQTRTMAELEEDASDGQMADYTAAELSGDYGAWGMIETEYKCDNCDHEIIIVSD